MGINYIPLVLLLTVANLIIGADRVGTYRENTFTGLARKFWNSPNCDLSSVGRSSILSTKERLLKIRAEAEKIRNVLNELAKSAFGPSLLRSIDVVTSSRVAEGTQILGKPRKVSNDWVRAAINPVFLRPKQFHSN